MTMRTTRPALLASLAVSALALGACGPAVSGGPASSSGSSGTDPGTTDTAAVDYSGIEPADRITVWSNHPGGSIDTENAIIADFTKETGITVDLVTAGANYEEVSQKFQTAQTSGDVGDVVVLSDATWFPAYLAGSIIPVDDVLEAAGADTSTYQETLFNDYAYEGAHYAVPYARSTPIFYYNKDLLAAAGVSTDAAPATWEDVKAAGEAVHGADANVAGFGFPPEAEYPAWTMANLVWGYGGSWSNEWDFSPLTSQADVDAIGFAQSGVTDGWATVLSDDPATGFSAGSVSMVIASTGSLTDILDTSTFDVGVGYLPAGPANDGKGGEGIVPTGGAGLAIAAKADPAHRLAAAQFVDFMTNAQNTATFSGATGYLPVRTDADMSAVYAEQPAFKVAVEQLARTRSQDYARALLPGGDLALSKFLQSTLTSGTDPTAALTDLQAQLQGLYDRDKAELGG